MTLLSLFKSMLPENILILGLLLLLFLEMVFPTKKNLPLYTIVGILTVTFISLFFPQNESLFPGHYFSNETTFILKIGLLLLAVVTLFSFRETYLQFKTLFLFLSSLLGGFLMLSSQNFMTLFIGLELLAIPTYTLVFLKNAEAALKYLVLGGTSSALFLFSGVFLYASTGSLSFEHLSTLTSSEEIYPQLFILFLFLSFFFKTALVPFHQWAPDAYDGADLEITSFMSVFIKGAYFLTLGRLFIDIQPSKLMHVLCGIIPLASILWGNIAAMKQKTFPRLIAYSSIAHAAYMFYLFIGSDKDKISAMLFYVLSYGIIVAASFIALNSLSSSYRDLSSFKGLGKRHPWLALLLSFSLLSLAGIPPFPGFFSKFFIFKNVLAEGHTLYALLALLGSYVGIYFYLRLIVMMYMKDEEQEIPSHFSRAGISLAFVSFLFLIPSIYLTEKLLSP